jgi:catechol 2,3-dioxygenase-like lactoylglutathione lyase family enzyme
MSLSDDESFRMGGGRWVSLGVADLARARAFYGGVLGLKELLLAEDAAVFDCGDMRLLVQARDDHATVRPGSPIYFRVDDLERARRDLEARGVVFTRALEQAGALDGRSLWTAEFLDPDGHRLALMMELPPGFTP